MNNITYSYFFSESIFFNWLYYFKSIDFDPILIFKNDLLLFSFNLFLELDIYNFNQIK